MLFIYSSRLTMMYACPLNLYIQRNCYFARPIQLAKLIILHVRGNVGVCVCVCVCMQAHKCVGVCRCVQVYRWSDVKCEKLRLLIRKDGKIKFSRQSLKTLCMTNSHECSPKHQLNCPQTTRGTLNGEITLWHNITRIDLRYSAQTLHARSNTFFDPLDVLYAKNELY